MGSLPQLSILTGERRDRGARETALHRQLEQNMRLAQCGENLALGYADETCEVRLTYDELNARANSVARALVAHARRSRSNSDGDFIVAVCMKPSHRTIVTLLGAWKAGAAYVPLEPSFPPARVTHILTDAEPVLLVYDETATPSMFAASGVSAISYDELCEQSAEQSTDNLHPEEQLADQPIAIILYTSGSTGIPKGVRLSHAAVSNRIWWQFRRFPFAIDECVCAWKTALTFVDSVCEIWAPLLKGRALIVLPREVTRDPQKMVAELTKYEIKRLVLVPTLLRSILMYVSLDPSERLLQKLKLWVCSGETLTKDLAGQFFKYFGNNQGYKLANFYGSTEVMGDVTYHVMETSEQLEQFSSIPIGTPLDNCVIYLLDSELSPVHVGHTGELWVAGDNLASGYVGGQGGEKFRTNPHATLPGCDRLYCTGDFGVIEKGCLLYAGRTDSQIKIRGHRIDLQEVDAAVSTVPGVDKCVVLCYGADTATPALLAFVTFTEGARMSSAHVESALEDKLTHYMIPQVIDVDSIPLLVNGKVDRQALLKMYENTNNNDDATIAVDIDYEGVGPGEIDKAEVLFTTVGEVVGRSLRGTLSLRSNFYELGGNSLNSIYTITQLREKGYFIEISDFLSARNLGEVLSLLSTAPGAGEEEATTFTPEPLADHHKPDVIEMIVSSFYEKADLERWLKHEIQPEDYGLCVCACWDALLAARLSVVLRDPAGAPVAVALNFDARKEPDIELHTGLAKIMQFLEYVEGPVRDTVLPEGEGTILHSFMMATAASLSARDNVAAIRALEHATLRVARERRFKGVFTTNTSPLTQQLGRDVLGFQTLLDYKVNEYVDPNGERTFAHAPDDQRAIVCWKPVD